MSEEEVVERDGEPHSPMRCVLGHRPPSCEKFEFTHRVFPQLSKSIRSIHWDCVNKTLNIDIEETCRCDVMQFIKYLEDFNVESKKSPFVDVQTNFAKLSLFDLTGHLISVVTLKNIGVTQASTSLCRFDSNPNEPLSFYLTLTYQSAEFEVAEEPVLTVDEEWQVDVI